MITHELGRVDTKIPAHVELQVSDSFRYEAKAGPSLFGARFAPLLLTGGKKPANLDRLPGISEIDHRQREELRGFLNGRFERTHRTSLAEGYSKTHAQVRGLMSCDELLDVDRAPQDRSRPLRTDRHRPPLPARPPAHRSGRDGRQDPQHLVGHPLGQLRGQSRSLLQPRPCLEHAPRRPGRARHARIDPRRDPLGVRPNALSSAPSWAETIGPRPGRSSWAGCGIHGGALVGKTNADGTAVTHRQVGPKHLFATYFRALGIDPSTEVYIGDRPVPFTDVGGEPIEELLT